MAANYVLLERVTVGAAGAASVTFSNIPQTGYTDLKIMFSARTDSSLAYENVIVKPNGATTNLSDKSLYTINGTSAASGVDGSSVIIGQAATSTDTANVFGNSECYIPNYTSSNYKSFSGDGVNENNATAATLMMIAGLWQSTAAITSLVIAPSIGTSFTQYSTFSLYGLAAVGTTPVIAPYASGGDIIQTDGTYWYHAFLGSGAFTPAKTLSCDVLVVAGGGGGGCTGAGGAGGVLAFTSQSISTSTQTVTVGAGGAGVGGNNTAASKGTNSQFASLTASLGGGAGGGTYSSANNGGSGGSSQTNTGSGNGQGTSGQGNNSGDYAGAPYYGAGGGGGAGSAGSNGTSTVGGAGGAGISTISPFGSFSSMFTLLGVGASGSIAGGGGGGTYSAGTGGTGGSGGGGNGSASGVGSSAVANTGSGGGGGLQAGTYYSGGNGGSGLVIVRYAI